MVQPPFLRLSPLAMAAGTAAASIAAVLLHLAFWSAHSYGMNAASMMGPYSPATSFMQRPAPGVILLTAIGAIVIAGIFGAIVAAVYNWAVSRLNRT